jgi:hypothetical protein
MADEKRDVEKGESTSSLKDEDTYSEVLDIPLEDLSIGKTRSHSIASDGSAHSDEDGKHVPTSNSAPASVMTHHHAGADIEKGFTGPPNRIVDEEGRIVVNWTSRKDPENPKNWPRIRKIFNVFVISLMTFLCPLCSSMFVCFSKPVSAKIKANFLCPVARVDTNRERFPNIRSSGSFFCLSIPDRFRSRSAYPCPHE